MKTSKAVKQQEESKARFAIEPYVDAFGKAHLELVKLHVNQPLTVET